MDVNRSSTFWAGRGNILLALHELLFSANIACAAGYALSLYVSRTVGAWPPLNDARYYFLRGVVRVSDVLHLAAGNPVSTHAVARGESVPWNQTALVTTFVVTVWSAAAVVLLLVRGFALRPENRTTFRRIAGSAALFAAPACSLAVWRRTWTWPSGLEPGEGPSPNAFFWFLFSVFVSELAIFFVLALVSRKHAISGWASGFLILLHSVFWGFFLFPSFPIYSRETRALYLIHVTLWLIPSMGAAWLLYVWPGPAAVTEESGKKRLGTWTLIVALVGVAALLVVWLPGKSHVMARTKDLNSAVIVLSRGTCFGTCPAYTISIHGDGAIEYMGERFVKVSGKQTASITRNDLMKILQRLDEAHFFALDDRAFAWCFDTSSVSIAVSVDGRAKSVVSDAVCTGAKSGVQDEFVTTADEIDKIVDSQRWVRCEGSCRF
jgi:hypothetical protein